MKPGERWSSWQMERRRRAARIWSIFARAGCLVGAISMSGFTAGCAHKAQQRADVERNLLSDRETSTCNESVLAHYQVGCPDVLTIELASAPGVRIRQVVGADGRIELAANVRPRVEGRSPVEIAHALATDLGIPPEAVEVRVAEYRSQQLFLFGQVVGWQRSVPYIGQETVLDLLQRVGGITPGAEPSDVYVVRAHIDEGGRPEVFHIDLQNIVIKHNQATNLRLLPNDQIYVGETRQSRIERVIPPWIRPLYQVIWDTQPPPKTSK
jgi:polysaccharide biosynthesis/export protein